MPSTAPTVLVRNVTLSSYHSRFLVGLRIGIGYRFRSSVVVLVDDVLPQAQLDNLTISLYSTRLFNDRRNMYLYMFLT